MDMVSIFLVTLEQNRDFTKVPVLKCVPPGSVPQPSIVQEHGHSVLEARPEDGGARVSLLPPVVAPGSR